MVKSAADVLKTVADERYEYIDLRFMDFPGLWQHFTIPADELTRTRSRTASGSTGRASAAGRRSTSPTCCSCPTPTPPSIDPFLEHTTLSSSATSRTRSPSEEYSRDPRYVARKAEDYLKSTGIADTSYFGPEPEFFIFDDVRFDQNQHSAYYYIDSDEGDWNTGRDEDGGEPGLQAPPQGGLLPGAADRPLPGHPHRDDAR